MSQQDAAVEAGWRDWRLEHDGLLDPDQPTESATVLAQRNQRVLWDGVDE